VTVEYKVEPNREQLREAIAFFEFVGGNTRDAMRIAINKAGPKIRTASSSEIRSQVRLKAGFVKQRLKFTRSTRAKLSGAIRTPSRGLLLTRFSTNSLISGDKVSWIETMDEQDLPFTVLVDSDDSAEESDYDFVRVTMPVTVARASKIVGSKVDAWHTQGNGNLADLIKELYTGGEDVGGLVDGIDYTGGSVDVLTDGARGVMVQAFFNVRFKFAHGDPYTQTP